MKALGPKQDLLDRKHTANTSQKRMEKNAKVTGT